MNLRLLMRKFVRSFLCCVTLLELVDKNTFGFNKGSLQRQDSKRSSSFYKVEEGMFKKVFKKSVVSHLAIHLCWTKSILILHIKLSRGKTSHFIWPLKSRHRFSGEQVLHNAGSVENSTSHQKFIGFQKYRERKARFPSNECITS